ncbi:MAG: serine/threonine-protein kinase, partial [Polyangiaceae bacterium]
MNEATLVQAPTVGAIVGDGYELVRFLGAGGMGAVYEAVSKDGRRVAVKLLLDQAASAPSPTVMKRFEREVSLTATLDDPHVVPTLDAGIDEVLGLPFMVMPLLVGMDVAQLVEKIGPVHPTVAARILRQACRALVYAHRQGVIHRDVKPANLFLDHARDGSVRVRVLDFGIAKWLESGSELTQTGAMLGTPHYMAPEQVLDAKSADERTDVWGLGISLYEALSDEIPFRELDSFAKLCVAITSQDTTPTLQQAAPWIEPGLAAIVHGALIREREDRCPDVASWAAALEPFTGGSDELNARMLEPLAPVVRGHAAAVAAIPRRWEALSLDGDAHAPAPREGDADPLLGKQVGDYELLRCLGHGGMGAVYEARDEEDRRVAIKVIRPEIAGTSASARKRFAREARMVQQIDDDHVVRIHEVAADASHALPYIVMDLLRGADLAVTVRQLGPLPPKVVARLFAQACAGLGAAHALGFIHRDVKPANLFLDRLPSGEVVLKVCDFGIAKEILEEAGAATEHLTRTGGMLGSPMYMSPEQATDAKTIDHRTDVWSLGASMFHALCGVPPWDGEESVGKLVLAVCTQPVPDVQERAPWVDGELASIVREAMRKDPKKRLATMQDFAERLRRFAGDDTTVTRDELRRLGRATLSRQPPRAVVPVSATSYGSGVASTIAGLPPARTPYKRWVGVAAGALVVIGGVAMWMAGRGPEQPAAVAETEITAEIEPKASAEPEPDEIDAVVLIEPASAEVEVDGERRVANDGALQLTGKPGQRIVLVLRHDGREHRDVLVLPDQELSTHRVAMPSASATTSAT